MPSDTILLRIPDADQLDRIVKRIIDIESFQSPDLAKLGDLVEMAVGSFRATAEALPPDMLLHRVSNWLTVGNAVIQSRLVEINIPTLGVVGEDDKLMPSLAESKRLLKILPQSEQLVVKKRGHLVLDTNVNLTEAILFSDIDPMNWKETRKPYDVVLDWKLPSNDGVEESIAKTAQPLREIHTVFFSTDEKGKRWRGLDRLPQTEVGADLRYLFAELWEQKRIVARGLAHPMLFMINNVTELGGRTPGIIEDIGGNRQTVIAGNDFQEFGALPVTPRNYYRLMQSGQTGLLFPGGAAEALSGCAWITHYSGQKRLILCGLLQVSMRQ